MCVTLMFMTKGEEREGDVYVCDVDVYDQGGGVGI